MVARLARAGLLLEILGGGESGRLNEGFIVPNFNLKTQRVNENLNSPHKRDRGSLACFDR